MFKCTGSISRGRLAEKHNRRDYTDGKWPDNIDRERTGENMVLVDRSWEEVYEETFGAATREYSEKQTAKGHPERAVPDYLAKVRADKQLKVGYEFVIQCGNMDEHPDSATAAAIYRDWLKSFTERYGANFAVKQAIVHLDESTPHMHVEVVPGATSKRGLSIQNSLNKAIKQAGHAGYMDMLAGWDEILTQRMREHGVERLSGDREKQRGGIDINAYKRTMAAEKAAQERIDALAEQEQAANERLELLRQAENRAEAEIKRVGERIMALESAGCPAEGRKLEERAGQLAREVEELRNACSEFAGQEAV